MLHNYSGSVSIQKARQRAMGHLHNRLHLEVRIYFLTIRRSDGVYCLDIITLKKTEFSELVLQK